jgi:hypothetical protein
MQKDIWQNSVPFHYKSSEGLWIEGVYFNIRKSVYGKPMPNIILNRRKWNFPLKSGMKQRCLLTKFFFNMALEFLVRAIKAREINKEDSNREWRSCIIPICR